MEEAIKLLSENPNGFLATVDDGKPRVRPFGFMFEEDGKFYFCTSTEKEVYKQLINLPYIEYSTMSQEMVTLRLTGEIKFCEDRAQKEKVLGTYEMVKNLYKSPDNPIFKVFYIEHGTIIIADFSGQPPRKYTF